MCSNHRYSCEAIMTRYTNISARNYSYMFNFEKEFVFQEKLNWMIQNWTSAFYYVTLYILVIFGTKYYMQDKPRFRLRNLLIVWNLGLSAFSVIAFVRSIPEFIHIIWNHSFYHSACVPSFLEMDRVSSYWTWLVVVSKLIELGDTVFIVLRKQPLIFLHWYHHIMTLMIVWYTYKEVMPTARWFLVMNLFVHSLMYFYYAVRAMGYTLSRKISMFLTTVQILQMIIGCGINIYVFHLLNNNVPCGISYKSVYIVFLLYFSYLVLFTNFFYQSYISGKKRARMDFQSNSSPGLKTKVH